MKKKWMVAPQEWWDPAAIEHWLEDEAKKGWRITSCNGWFARFEKTEPKDCRVRIQYQGPMERKAWEERIAAYEELGWEFAVAHGQDYEVFYCDDPAAPEPDTDPEVYALAWKAPLRRSWWGGLALFLVPLLLAVEILVLDTTLLQQLLRSSFRLLFFELITVPFCVIQAVRQLRRVSRARKALEAGMKPASGSWKRSRRWWRAFCALFLGFWLVASVADVFWAARIPGPDGMASILPAALGEVETAGDWEFDWHGYAYQSTPLRPVWYDTQYRRANEAVVRNSWNRLAFDWLAKVLYREKRNEFLDEWPGAVSEKIEAPAVDEAVLLTGGEDTQMLLVRSGTMVYSLWVNFPVEMKDYIDSAAAKAALQDGGAA